jgi:hypothetical protein
MSNIHTKFYSNTFFAHNIHVCRLRGEIGLQADDYSCYYWDYCYEGSHRLPLIYHRNDVDNTDIKILRENPVEIHLSYLFFVPFISLFRSLRPHVKQRIELHIYSSDGVVSNLELPPMEMREYNCGVRTTHRTRSQVTHIAINRYLLHGTWTFARLRLCNWLKLPLWDELAAPSIECIEEQPVFSYLWSDFADRNQVIQNWRVVIIRGTMLLHGAKIVKLTGPSCIYHPEIFLMFVSRFPYCDFSLLSLFWTRSSGKN